MRAVYSHTQKACRLHLKERVSVPSSMPLSECGQLVNQLEMEVVTLVVLSVHTGQVLHTTTCTTLQISAHKSKVIYCSEL